MLKTTLSNDIDDLFDKKKKIQDIQIEQDFFLPGILSFAGRRFEKKIPKTISPSPRYYRDPLQSHLDRLLCPQVELPLVFISEALGRGGGGAAAGIVTKEISFLFPLSDTLKATLRQIFLRLSR